MIKRSLVVLATLSLCCLNQSAWSDTSKVTKLDNKKDKISYSIGMDIGKSIQKQNIELNPELFMVGLKDGITDKSSLMTEDEVRQTLLALQTEIMEKQNAQMKNIAAKNLADGEKFLAENKKQKGVITTKSGLQYKIINEGTGDSPKTSDIVTTQYRGKLIDGTEFDSSYSRGEPARFAVKDVIPGWTEALQMMKPGAKWELFIPAKLAYGESGIGQLIGPNSTLVFDVELISVEKPKTTETKAN